MDSETKYLQRATPGQAEMIFKVFQANAKSSTVPMEIMSLEQFQELFSASMYWFWRTNRNILAIVHLTSFNAQARSAEFGAVALVRGAGNGREAFRALAALGFHSMGLHRIYCFVNADNEPCLKALAAVGMRKEGRSVHSRFKDGKWVDQLQFGVLETERKVWDSTWVPAPRPAEDPAEEGAA